MRQKIRISNKYLFSQYKKFKYLLLPSSGENCDILPNKILLTAYHKQRPQAQINLCTGAKINLNLYQN